LLTGPAAVLRRYEREEAPNVCKAMEHAARYLLFNTSDVTVEDS
jgi:hypothetical protein